jgi:Dyp-type peroxidase family
MTQAKGILPSRPDDTRTLLANPKTCGYFIAVMLRPDLDAAGLEAWLRRVTGLVDELVARLPDATGKPEGEKVAAVAMGLGTSFFYVGDQRRFGLPADPPAGFDRSAAGAPVELPWDSAALRDIPRVEGDVLFYVVSVFEARVARFIEALQATAPDVVSLAVERGYQRIDGDEPFGYRDGVRNIVPKTQRSRFVFTHEDREVDEPSWAIGGSYLSTLRIVQNRAAFARLADDGARDAVIGRRRDGTRNDLTGVEPKDEPAEPAPALQPESHVRKAGPRGPHDDVQIFRRGLPFLEVDGGQIQVGLHFASFESSLDAFDTVINDWIFAPNFPGEGAGPDRLLDPASGLTTIKHIGLYFVPPYDARFVAAALFDRPAKPGKTGRLVVRKRIVDPADPRRRFERRGIVFRVKDAAGQQIGLDFATTSTGRAVFPAELPLGSSFTLEEVSSPIPVQPLAPITFQMTKPNVRLNVVNAILQPNTPYSG